MYLATHHYNHYSIKMATPCRACHRSLLDAFVSIASLSLRPARPLIRRHVRIQPINPLQKQLHSSSIWQQSHVEKLEQDDLTAGQLPTEEAGPIELPETPDPAETEPTAAPATSATLTPPATSHIPWYLQVQPPTPVSPVHLPNLAAQEIPPLPENAPDILDPLLQHLSISIGLDHLTILDLRDLRPPSALGVNLLMILGTARSEKHLNTSADRFCRWLRNTYRIRPFADGLSGRNELKLKLRRRNKKMKLAQSVGNTTYDQGYDDGITTGWICCNLGDVSQAKPVEAERTEDELIDEEAEGEVDTDEHIVYSQKDQERPLEDEPEYKNPAEEDFKYRGFGDNTFAPRIVVQMFTEQKRLEMDLEGLWEQRLTRRERKEEKRKDRLTKEDDAQAFETSIIESELSSTHTRHEQQRLG